jgi:hypothetical protein
MTHICAAQTPPGQGQSLQGWVGFPGRGIHCPIGGCKDAPRNTVHLGEFQKSVPASHR